jgi:hypothetical protein
MDVEDDGVQLGSSGISCCGNWTQLKSNPSHKINWSYLDVFLFEDSASFAKLNQVTVSDASYQQCVGANLQSNRENVKQAPDNIQWKRQTDILLTCFKFQLRKLEKNKQSRGIEIFQLQNGAYRVDGSKRGALVHALVDGAVAVEHLYLEATF